MAHGNFESGGAGVYDLLDRTKYRTITGDDSPERQRDVTALCSAPCSPTGFSALLKKSRLLYLRRPMTIYCVGNDYQSAFNAAADIRSVVNDARTAQMFVACSTDPSAEAPPLQYLVRQIGNQTYPSVWTILDGEVLESQVQLSSLNIIVLKVELLIMEGAAYLNGNGFPQSGTYPASLPM